MTKMKTEDVIATTRRHESTAVNTFSLGDQPPLFVRGEGAHLFTEQGEAYLDLFCGSAVSNLGHNHPRQRAVMEQVMAEGIFHTGTRLASRARAELFGELAKRFPAELDTVHFMVSGSEAVESALKAARYATGKRGIIAFHGGFHGRTMGALAVTSANAVRDPFGPLDGDVTFAPYPDSDHPPFRAESHEELGTRCLDYLDYLLSSPISGMAPTAAMIVEAVQGNAGIVVPPDGFLKGLRKLCDRYNIAMIIDEVWNGFGRTGHWFAFERENIVPDMVTIAKGLTSSLPLSAVVGRAEYLKSWPSGLHTGTFQGNPVACAVATETIRILEDEQVMGRVRQVIAPLFEAHFKPLAALEAVRAVRIDGGHAAIELAPDGDLKRGAGLARLIQEQCLDANLLIYAGGAHKNCVMLMPPLIAGETELGEAFTVIAASIRAALQKDSG